MGVARFPTKRPLKDLCSDAEIVTRNRGRPNGLAPAKLRRLTSTRQISSNLVPETRRQIARFIPRSSLLVAKPGKSLRGKIESSRH